MAFPIEIEGFGLRGDALRNWLRTDGAKIFTTFRTGGDTLDWLRDQGAKIRTQDFYAIRREVLGTIQSGNHFDWLSGGLIPLGRHFDGHGLSLSSDYLYRIKLSGFEPGTNNRVERWVSVSSNRQLSAEEVWEGASNIAGAFNADSGVYSIEFGEIQPLIRPGIFG